MGLGLIVQIIFGSGPGSGLIKKIAIKRYIENFELSRAIFFSQRKSFSSYARDSRAPETNPTYLIFSGIFVAAPSQK
jgi:hypothetical protein